MAAIDLINELSMAAIHCMNQPDRLVLDRGDLILHAGDQNAHLLEILAAVLVEVSQHLFHSLLEIEHFSVALIIDLGHGGAKGPHLFGQECDKILLLL